LMNFNKKRKSSLKIIFIFNILFMILQLHYS
jgi:hypothetical protein